MQVGRGTVTLGADGTGKVCRAVTEGRLDIEGKKAISRSRALCLSSYNKKTFFSSKVELSVKNFKWDDVMHSILETLFGIGEAKFGEIIYIYVTHITIICYVTMSLYRLHIIF